MKILILGGSGMLGNAMFRVMSEKAEAYATVRSAAAIQHFPTQLQHRIFSGVDVLDQDSLIDMLGRLRPDVVVNCVGLVKQLAESEDPLNVLPINSILPHRLARICALAGARLVHVSTDCVFEGTKGGYLETDVSDATDLYGKSKFIGEVDYPNAVTLRTSIIGHELGSAQGLVEWFLSQKGGIKGYAKAVFSGLPTVELARVIRDVVIPRPDLRGVYHVASAPIAKLDLLRLIATVYGKEIDIMPDGAVVIDRSLNAERFLAVTGYAPPPWLDLVKAMHTFR